MKKTIHLKESELHAIIKESVKRILRESTRRNRRKVNEDIEIGSGGGYYGTRAIFTIRTDANGNPTMYEFSPQGWDFDTKSQLEAAAVCSTARDYFIKEMEECPEIDEVPVVQPTDEDKELALYWLTGGNAEWNHGYWAEGGVNWDEAKEHLMSDSDIIGLIDNAVSGARSFYELILNLKSKSDVWLLYAADAVADLFDSYDDEE